jgi:hypothetical protein
MRATVALVAAACMAATAAATATTLSFQVRTSRAAAAPFATAVAARRLRHAARWSVIRVLLVLVVIAVSLKRHCIGCAAADALACPAFFPRPSAAVPALQAWR